MGGFGRVAGLNLGQYILPIPPPAAERLKERDRVGITVGLRDHEGNPGLLIGALRVEQRQISDGAGVEALIEMDLASNARLYPSILRPHARWLP